MDGSPATTTATGTRQSNTDGSAIAITVFTTLRWWGRPWLTVVFQLARWFPGILQGLRKLSFIHFARWTVLRTLPYNGPPQSQEQPLYPHLFFESNFNGGWEEYIDAFSSILTRGMSVFWRSSFGFPGPLPTPPFKDYIRLNQIDAAHFYSAYPDATTTMVTSSLRLRTAVADLAARAESLTAVEFDAAWTALLSDVQGCL